MKLLWPALCAGLLASAAFAADAPPGALACSGCHPTGKGVETPAPRLVGRPAADIKAAMLAFRTGARPASVMDRISKGFGESEAAAIAEWYAAQKD